MLDKLPFSSQDSFISHFAYQKQSSVSPKTTLLRVWNNQLSSDSLGFFSKLSSKAC